ncbi:uncharacterized protein LOC119171097 [Rhipicephalus microplus]|uniref:uncharacterized protein LOC119171097 n=1 Tax=Rhipicephalus microplus TaxID=6941 RepID=UPI003F6AA2A5
MQICLKMLMAFLSFAVVMSQDSDPPVVSSMDAGIEKCEPAMDYKFFIWRRIYQPCQYLCAGGFIVFENEDDGTACSTLSVPNGECLNGKCVGANKTPDAPGVPSTTVFVEDAVTTSGSSIAEIQTAGSTGPDDTRVQEETQATEFAALTSTTSGTTDEHANAAGEEAQVDEYCSAAP